MSTLNLSDKSDISKDSQIVSRVQQYSDLDLRFKIHPGYGDIVPVKDITAIKNSVRTILLTNYGEKPFQPDFGSNITQFLFEPSSPITIALMREEIKRSIGDHEPRVVVRDVMVNNINDASSANVNDIANKMDLVNAISISVTVLVINSQQIVDISLYLERTR